MDVRPIDPAGESPPYEQLRAQLASRVASGELAPGTKLPTVRALAADLGLAVNTVAKAYRSLESDAVVVTEGRRGTFVASSAVAGSGEAAEAAASYAATARRLGLTPAEAHKLLDESWASGSR
jgi:DNA-binding transcriptional regulator YhcF (GntR family)